MELGGGAWLGGLAQKVMEGEWAPWLSEHAAAFAKAQHELGENMLFRARVRAGTYTKPGRVIGKSVIEVLDWFRGAGEQGVQAGALCRVAWIGSGYKPVIWDPPKYQWELWGHGCWVSRPSPSGPGMPPEPAGCPHYAPHVVRRDMSSNAAASC